MSEEAMEMITVSSDDPKMKLNAKGVLDEMRVSQNSLRTLAEETGGFATVNRNDLTPAFARIVQANAHTTCSVIIHRRTQEMASSTRSTFGSSAQAYTSRRAGAMRCRGER